MQPAKEHAVLIVEAGPTGLVLGIELARRGVPFHLIDRLTEPRGWDRAVFIKSRSLEVFAGIGAVDAFWERGQFVHGIDVCSDAERVAGYRFDNLDPPFPYILSIPENETERLVNERLEQFGGRVERGVEFLSTPEGQDFAALAESELGIGYEYSPIVTEIGAAIGLSARGTRIGFRVGEAAGLEGRNGAACRPDTDALHHPAGRTPRVPLPSARSRCPRRLCPAPF